jgi:hypothetical protein
LRNDDPARAGADLLVQHNIVQRERQGQPDETAADDGDVHMTFDRGLASLDADRRGVEQVRFKFHRVPLRN